MRARFTELKNPFYLSFYEPNIEWTNGENFEAGARAVLPGAWLFAFDIRFFVAN